MRFLLLALFLSPRHDDPIRGLVSNLGDDNPAVREAASAELRRIGTAALPALEAAAADPDVEVRVRALDLLHRIQPWRQSRQGAAEALGWLGRHQSADGSWTSKTPACGCAPPPPFEFASDEDFAAGLTGLSLLAFVRGGSVASSPGVIRRAVAWIAEHQGIDGRIGPETAAKPLYGHAICTLALAELFEASPSPEIKPVLRKAADYLITAQNPGKGWRYLPRGGDNDTSVTFWCVLALLAAKRAGFDVPESAFRGVLHWLDEVTETHGYGRVGYTHRDTGKISCPGPNEYFDHHPTTTAQGHLVRMLLGTPRRDPTVTLPMEILIRDLPSTKGFSLDSYFWLAGTLALREHDGPGGPKWRTWEAAVRPAILGIQKGKFEGCSRGSWDPVDRWSMYGGRVYATAVNALTLQACAPR
jgi:hypothetical protein